MSNYSDASLVMFPSGRKATKLYSQKPTDGTGDFTVSRAGKKNEINSDLKLELIAANVPAFNFATIGGCPVLNTEPQATNLITYPISLGNSYWTKSGAEINGDPSTAGANLVANGGMETGGTVGVSLPTNWSVEGAPTAAYKSSTIVHSGSYSIYCENVPSQGVKSDVFNFIAGRNYELTAWVYVVSNTSSGEIYASRTNPAVIDFNVYATNTTGVWQKITTTSQALTTGTSGVKFLQAGTGTTIFYVDDVSVKEVQGYSAPSVDFPTSAFKLVEDTSTGLHRAYKTALASGVSANTQFIYSVYAKKSERNWILLKTVINTQSVTVDVWFDLENGVVGTESNGTGYIEALANDWFRCSILITTDGTATSLNSYSYLADADNNESYTGDGTSGVYLFMAQLEESSVATSPTFTDTTLAAEGSTTTRLADVVTGAGDVNTFNDSEGVLFAEISALVNPVTFNNWLTITDGTNANSVSIVFETTGAAIGRIEVGGVGQAYITTSVDYSNLIKVAFKYKENDFAWWVNGVEVGTDSSGITFPSNTLNSLQFSYGSGGNNWVGNTKQLQYFDTALTDAELQALTTL